MANLITLARFLLLFVLVTLIFGAPPAWQLANAPLLLFIIALDGLDGYVARRRGETSVFGSIFDIAVDRAVELVLWVALGHVGLVPIWVAMVFIIRGIMVDAIRYAAISRGETAFGMMRSAWGRFLVAGRFMRGFYGGAKAVTFGWILLLQPLPVLAADMWAEWSATMTAAASALVGLSVFLCIARGLPVLVEFLIEQDLFGRRAGREVPPWA